MNRPAPAHRSADPTSLAETSKKLPDRLLDALINSGSSFQILDCKAVEIIHRRLRACRNLMPQQSAAQDSLQPPWTFATSLCAGAAILRRDVGQDLLHMGATSRPAELTAGRTRRTSTHDAYCTYNSSPSSGQACVDAFAPRLERHQAAFEWQRMQEAGRIWMRS